MTTLTFHGHACFSLTNGTTTLLFDPFFTGNPITTTKAEEVTCNYILVSHGHGDHLGDTVQIAKRTGATVIATAELAALVGQQDCANISMHLGGKRTFDFGYVRVTPAFHGSGVPGGHAAGFIVSFFGKTVYFAGDTALFGDMALLGRLEKIDYALLPIGDNYTMGPADAFEAVKLLNPRAVIPMHYNTWPLIAQSPEAFKAKVEELHIPVHIVAPGESINL
ncbi:metal-dependent hydrolase [Sporomusa sp.]|uniref:metal-dependent hydrolase n=1 Tax=Sporomusa sp. TaxID=2078658 RepID=UPI002D0B51C0|nr:metal-dependent hydrolase [Sporomusa sp.]HWR08668.1 metal-dependent hydrolase [Sporomusa sp.]